MSKHVNIKATIFQSTRAMLDGATIQAYSTQDRRKATSYFIQRGRKCIGLLHLENRLLC